MYLVVIAWMYVAVMMAVAEATHVNGTVLGALITFLLYGLGPLSLVLYLMGTPARRRAIKAREARETAHRADTHAPAGSRGGPIDPDTGGHASGGPEQTLVAPVRKEP